MPIVVMDGVERAIPWLDEWMEWQYPTRMDGIPPRNPKDPFRTFYNFPRFYWKIVLGNCSQQYMTLDFKNSCD